MIELLMILFMVNKKKNNWFPYFWMRVNKYCIKEKKQKEEKSKDL